MSGGGINKVSWRDSRSDRSHYAPYTCVRAAAPQRYVFICLNKCIEQVSGENISIKVLHFNRVRASRPFISMLKQPAWNTARRDELWGTSLRAAISARQHGRTLDNRTQPGGLQLLLRLPLTEGNRTLLRGSGADVWRTAFRRQTISRRRTWRLPLHGPIKPFPTHMAGMTFD